MIWLLQKKPHPKTELETLVDAPLGFGKDQGAFAKHAVEQNAIAQSSANHEPNQILAKMDARSF